MARGVKAWIAVVVVGSAAMFGLIRTWTNSVARILPGMTGRDSLSLVHDSLVREAGRTANAVQRIRWSRAIGHGANSLLVLGDPIPVPERVRRVIAEARAALAPDERVAVAVTTRRWQRPWDGTRYIAYTESRGIDYLLHDGGPCQVVIFVPVGPNAGGFLDDVVHPDRVLGPCAFAARYGPPSPTVRAWFQDGGGRIAGSATPSSRAATSGKDHPLTGLEAACLNGNVEACAAAVSPRGTPFVLHDDRAAPPDLVLHDHDLFPGYAFSGLGAHLLADIEAEIGANRFAALWRTDQPVETALSDALGRPLGEWVADWAAARFPTPTRHAGVDFLDILLSLIAIAGFAAIGLRTGAKGRPVTGL